jgi:hypothetical protein
MSSEFSNLKSRNLEASKDFSYISPGDQKFKILLKHKIFSSKFVILKSFFNDDSKT